MTQKDKIIDLLTSNKRMTQVQLAKSIYGDNLHTPNIHSALMELVKNDYVLRSGNNPSYYSLGSKNFEKRIADTKKRHKVLRDVSKDIISNDTINELDQTVLNSHSYGEENNLITDCFKAFPQNADLNVVAMKIGLIDITNSTNISRHKSRISVVDLAKSIISIPDIDIRLKNGDPNLVNEIAKTNGSINLFSFASKYCCYHNRNLYDNDDYSIYDSVLRDYLPLYFDDINKSQIDKWVKSYDYKSYNDYITTKLDELRINTPFRKRKFDHFVWFLNRNGE